MLKHSDHMYEYFDVRCIIHRVRRYSHVTACTSLCLGIARGPYQSGTLAKSTATYRDVYQFNYLRSDLLPYGILAKMLYALQANVPRAWFIRRGVVARRRVTTQCQSAPECGTRAASVLMRRPSWSMRCQTRAAPRTTARNRQNSINVIERTRAVCDSKTMLTWQ